MKLFIKRGTNDQTKAKIYTSKKTHRLEYPNGFAHHQPFARVVDLRETGISAYQFCISQEYVVGDIVIESDSHCLVQETGPLFEYPDSKWKGTRGTLDFFSKISAEVRDYLASL